MPPRSTVPLRYGLAFVPQSSLATRLASGRRLRSAAPVDAAEEQAFRRAAFGRQNRSSAFKRSAASTASAGCSAGTAATTGVVVSEDGYIVSSAFNFISKPSTILVQVEGSIRSRRDSSPPTICEC